MNIVHEPMSSRFLEGSGADAAVLTYRLEATRVVFDHTLVPPSRRGQGIAEALVRTGLAWARAQGLAVVAECSYVDRFLARHPELGSP